MTESCVRHQAELFSEVVPDPGQAGQAAFLVPVDLCPGAVVLQLILPGVSPHSGVKSGFLGQGRFTDEQYLELVYMERLVYSPGHVFVEVAERAGKARGYGKVHWIEEPGQLIADAGAINKTATAAELHLLVGKFRGGGQAYLRLKYKASPDRFPQLEQKRLLAELIGIGADGLMV